MKDEDKTKEQLMNELVELRRRIAELETTEAERKRVEDKLRRNEARYRALFADSQRQAQELSLLNQVRTALAGELDLPVLFRTVVEAIADTFGYEFVSLYLLQDDVLVLQHQVGYDRVIEKIPMTQGVTGRVVRTGEPVLLEDVRTDPAFLEAVEGIVSEVCVPLFDQDTPVGVLNVEGSALGEVDLRLMTALSEHVSVAIGRARLYAEVQEGEDRYLDLYDNAPDMYFTVRRDGTIVSVNRLGAEMLGYEKEELIGRPVTVVFHPEDAALVQQQIDEILDSGEGISKLEFRKVRKDGSVMYVSERISLQHDPQGELTLRIICRDITERQRAEEELRQHTAQLEALREVELGLAAELDLDDLLHSIVSRAVELLGGYSGAIDLYRPDLDVLEWIVSVGIDQSPLTAFLHRGEGLCGKVWESGEPLIVNDYHHWEGRAAGWEDHPFQALMAVPVYWAEEFLGVLEVSAVPPRTFSPADSELLSLFANQAAIAIRNVRLYDDARSRAERLAVVNHVARAVGATLDLDHLMETVYREVMSVFEADAFFIALYAPPSPPKLGGEGGGELDYRLQVDEGIREPRERRSLGTGLTSLVVGEKRPILIRDFEKEKDRLPDPGLWGTMKTTASWLGAPMLIGERLIGVICVQDYRPYVYGEEEELLLSTIADQVAVAIEQVRLYEAERDQRELAEALEEAAAALTATLDFDQVLDRILDQVGRVVPHDAVNIMLVEDHQVRAVRWRGYERFGADDLFSTLMLDLSELRGLQQMADTREPLAIPDVTTYPGWVQVHEWLRSYAAAPILVHGEVIGFLSVDSATPGFFTQAHAEALRAFAGHAAVAIENARLYEAERRRLAELESLHQASLHLTSTLELEPILEAILDHALKLVAADDTHIFLYDGERLAFGAAMWEDGRRSQPYSDPRPQGLTYTVARSGERMVVPDVDRHPMFQDYQWGGAIVGLPLRIGERVVGVMNVSFETPHAFDESELRVLRLLADQAAVAIENARLYEAAQREIAERKRAEERLQQRELRLSVLNQMGRALAETLELPRIYRIAYEHVAQLVDCPNFGISLYDPPTRTLRAEFMLDEGELIDVAQFPPLVMDMEPTQGRVRAIATRQPEIITNYPAILEKATGSRVRIGVSSSEHVTGAAMYVPMVARGQVIGLLEVQSYQLNAYDVEHAELLGPVANQIGLSIQNARLFGETRRLQEFNQSIVQSMAEGIAIEDAEGVFTFVNPAAAEMLGYRPEELVGQHWTTVIPPDQQPIVQASDERRKRGESSSYELELVRKDGERLSVLVSGSPRFEDGRFAGTLAVFADITERKRAEEELRQSFERLQIALEGTVDVLVSAVEMKDPYTAGHQRRVTQLACAIARELNLPQEQIEGLRMASLIHDLGKISIPAEILSKPTPLMELEWGMIRTHPQVGYDILKRIDFPWPVAETVLQHHERLDGSGYPQGLLGKDILMKARILAVADVVEAMASHRPYRPLRGLQEALEEISQNRGVLYDSEVVVACLKLFTEEEFEFK